MNKRHPTPTLFEVPRWTPAILKPPTGRTYGSPGEHLELTADRAQQRLLTTTTLSVAALLAALTATLYGIRTIYFSDMEVGAARLAQAGIIAALLVLYFTTNPISRARDLMSQRGRTLAGLEGERRVAELLEELPNDYYIIHGVDITWPDQLPEDIDHVIVGPTGLTLVDTKNYSGDLVLTENTLLHNGENITPRLIDGSLRRASQLTTFLGWEAPVRVVVAFTGRARITGSLKNVHLTDRNGLKKIITDGSKAIHPDMVKEVAEDIALLSPAATTAIPWRFAFKYLPPTKQRAHKYHLFYWPATILQVPFGLIAAFAGGVSAFNIFHALMATGRELLAPHEVLASRALTATANTLGTHVFYPGVLVIGTAAAVGLNHLSRYLHLSPQVMLPPMQAERAEGRSERLRATALIGPDGSPRPHAPHSNHAKGHATPTRQDLERVFTEDLILPPDTLEELITVQLLLTSADEFKREWGQDLPYGVILHGPPGTGKTQIARTMAKAAGFSFYAAIPSDLRDKWVGESAKHIHNLYQQARANAPALVFIDEIDAVASKRGAAIDGAGQEGNHAVNQLLQEIDGLVKHDQPVFTVGATNLLDNLDDAIKSRLAYQVLIDLPDLDARNKMWRKFSTGYQDRLEVSYEELAHASEGMSGRDIRQVVVLAAQFGYAGDNRVTRHILQRAFERIGRNFA